jgi:hypothetical protein
MVILSQNGTSVKHKIGKRLARHRSRVHIITHQKQPENVKYFNYLDSMITSDARFTREIRSRIAMESSVHQEPCCFRQQIRLKFKEDTNKVLQLEQSFVWRWNLDASERRSEIIGKFWNMVLENISGADRVRIGKILQWVQEEMNNLHTVTRRKATWIGQILYRNWLIRHIIEGKI